MKTEKPPLLLNVLPIAFKPKNLTCSFFEKRPSTGYFVSLTSQEIPRDISEKYDRPLYTDFGTHKQADITLTVNLEKSPRFMRHYLNYRLYHWFSGKAGLVGKDFTGNNGIYIKIPEKTGALPGIQQYKLIMVRPDYGKFTEGYELTVFYKGITSVWTKNILEYEGSSHDFGRVVHRGHVYKYETLIQEPGVDRTKVYPVLNRAIVHTLGLNYPVNRSENKIKAAVNEIGAFYRAFFQDPDFVNIFGPDAKGYLRFNREHAGVLAETNADLLFGNNVVSKDPYEGLKNGGPWQPPPAPHFKLFFIVHEQQAQSIGNALYKQLRYGTGHYPGFSKFAHIPLQISNRHITFRDAGNPLPEIKEQLKGVMDIPDMQYVALYISPIHREDTDHERHRVYYRVKELLLKHGITSQTVDERSVRNPSFAYYLPNISVAMVAKLGGIPWRLAQTGGNDLILGIGAYRPNEFRKTYLGSTFCFSNRGDFRGFDVFTKDNLHQLAGAFQKAVYTFYKEREEPVGRIVIHFYKKMNREESAVLVNALKELKIEVPLIIATIYKTKMADLFLADTDVSHYLPLSGTWFSIGRQQYLLYSNTRFGGMPGNRIKNYPMPLKVRLDTAGSADADIYFGQEGNAESVLAQIYRFTRLNWQTVSIKDTPVTLRYPEMVAQRFPYFDSNAMPQFGTRNLWFL